MSTDPLPIKLSKLSWTKYRVLKVLRIGTPLFQKNQLPNDTPSNIANHQPISALQKSKMTFY